MLDLITVAAFSFSFLAIGYTLGVFQSRFLNKKA